MSMHTIPMHTDIRDTLCTPGMSCQGTSKLIRCSVVLNTLNSMCTIEGGHENSNYLDICSGTVLGEVGGTSGSSSLS